jgi:hypothetical protein
MSALDFLIGFEREDDARRVLAVLAKRLGRFGLAIHPDKTRLVPVGRPPQGQQRGKVRPPSTFWASRALGRGPGRVDGGGTARPGGRASDPTFKGVRYAAVNFVPLPLLDTRPDQCPQLRR